MMLLVEHVTEPIREPCRVGVMWIIDDRGRKRQAGDPRARLVIHPEGVRTVSLVLEVRDVAARELVLEVLTNNLNRPNGVPAERLKGRQGTRR
jgi:hypothetical protein